MAGALAAFLAAPQEARGAAAQTWSPFVLVSGLLLVGMVAEADGLFRAAGSSLARVAPNGVSLFVGATLLVIVVTATLNLDTSVVFLTPVLIAASRQRGRAERSLLYGSLLLANASSLFLPGSNLTNLIVLGHHPLSGGGFLALMWPAALAACVVTACCIGVWARQELVAPATPGSRSRSTAGLLRAHAGAAGHRAGRRAGPGTPFARARGARRRCRRRARPGGCSAG